MRLSRLEAVVLGLLTDAPSHGYALRARLAPGLPRDRQPNDGVLYPLLARLERRGLLERRPDQRGAQARHVYAATSDGRAAFAAWLRADTDGDGVDHGLFLDHPFLKLLFAGHLTPAERGQELDRVAAGARARLAALDGLARGGPAEGFGPVGDVVLELGRAREHAVLAAAERLGRTATEG